MTAEPRVQPLSYRRRAYTFYFLAVIFACSLPFLYLYAIGYRFEFGEETTLVSTGGIYVAAERSGAEIFIDGELVRETRVFRRAFYAQNLEPGTHRVHVQKEGNHTWVKDLPVYPHIVTEAQAFNLPLIPQVQVFSPWLSATGTVLVDSPLLRASTTNEIYATSSINTKTATENTEFQRLLELFSTTSATSTDVILSQPAQRANIAIHSTSTIEETATTTKEWQGVRLFKRGEDVYAAWYGEPRDMPYYYCAEEFELLASGTPEVLSRETDQNADVVKLLHPVQQVSEDAECRPEIRIDRKGQEVRDFDFFPGSTDFVVMVLEDGVYVVEVDDRSWQNVQPLITGEDLLMRIENGNIYVYDGTLIYYIVLT